MGRPAVLDDPPNVASRAFEKAAENIAAELSIAALREPELPEIRIPN
jgi:hypothetical protein